MPYSERKKKAVWRKAAKIPHKDPNKYRRDVCGNQIYYASYGKNSRQGWEVDHRYPKSRGGSNHIINLQPLQTSTNRHKSASRSGPRVYCACRH